MFHDEIVKNWNHNKTCKVCAWGRDGFCKKPNKNSGDSMSECFVDSLQVKDLFAKQTCTRSWLRDNNPNIRFLSLI